MRISRERSMILSWLQTDGQPIASTHRASVDYSSKFRTSVKITETTTENRIIMRQPKPPPNGRISARPTRKSFYSPSAA
jgi:hypothetical protein